MEIIDFTVGKQIEGTIVRDINDGLWTVLRNIANATAQPREGQYYTKYTIPVVEPEPVTVRILLDAKYFNANDMAELNLPNIKVIASEAGTYPIVIQATANGLTTEKVVDWVVKPDPTPPPPVSPYPPDTTYTALGAIPSLAKMGYLQEVKENYPFGDGATRTIKQMSDPVVYNTTNGDLLNYHYSKTQAWNCDQSRMIIGRKLCYGDGRIIKDLGGSIGVNFQWSYTDPDKLYYVTDNRIYSFVPSGSITNRVIIKDLGALGYSGVSLGYREGHMTRDNTKMAINGVLAGVPRIMIWNIQTATLLVSKTWEQMGINVADKSPSTLTNSAYVNFASISCSGNYVVVRVENTNNSHFLYDSNLNFIRDMGANISHASFGYSQAGHEVLISCIPLGYQRLDTGEKTRIILNADIESINGHSGGHSAAAWQRDGWMYIGFREGKREILAVKLDTSGTVERFGFSRDTSSTGSDETQASPSPDGTMVLFKARWNGDANTLSYLIKRTN